MVTVTDTGIGVPPEDQERIFESFQQGRRGAPKEEGTGLGLTLSRRIVGLFGGRMWLESTPGVGSTFGFSIPGLPEQADEVASHRAARASRRRPRRRRPGVAGSHLGLPGRFTDSGAAGQGRRRGSRADPQGAAGRRRARHQAAAAGWLAGTGRAQGGPGHRRYPGGHRLRRRRSVPGPGPRRGRVSAQAGSSRRTGRRAATAWVPWSAIGVVVTPRRILVVEDNPLNLKLVRDVLQFAGYDVIEASPVRRACARPSRIPRIWC